MIRRFRNKQDGHQQLPTGPLMQGKQIGNLTGLEAARGPIQKRIATQRGRPWVRMAVFENAV